jgi:ribosomal protein S18 acetylase RimI-like enzyme
VWDDDAKTWLVAATPGRVVLGFIGVAARGHRTYVESLYVQPDCGTPVSVAAALVRAAVTRFGDQDLHAVVHRDHTGPYRAAGFEVTGQRGQFPTLIRKAPSA